MKYWKIKGYEHYYLGEDLNVYSTASGNMTIRKPKKTNDGHVWYILSNGGDTRLVGRHVIVAEMFVHNDDPENKNVVHHKNWVKTDDRPENLEWVSKKQHAEIHMKGTHQTEEHRRKRSEAMKGNNNAKSYEVEQWTKDDKEFIRVFKSSHEAERETGIPHSNINACCNKKPHFKTAGGYRWRYRF